MKRRIVVITEIIAPYRIPVFNALSERPDVDLAVLFLSETDPGLRDWLVYKQEIRFPYEVLSSWRRRIGSFHILLNQGVSAALDRLRPELVICGGYNYLASWQAQRWAKSRRIPFVLWSESNARDIRAGRRFIEFLKNKFLDGCDGFVVPGKASEKYLRLLGVDGRPVVVAPNAVDNAFFFERSSRAREHGAEVRKKRGLPERYFLFVGRLVREKGVFELVEAYAKLDAIIRQSVGLVFVGDGPARAELTRCAAKSMEGRVLFFGFAQREDLPDFYALAEASILPTHSDTWGLVVNEAMACGQPVIVSSAAGCVEDLLLNGENGLVVQPEDVAELVLAMARVASDEDLRKQMSVRSCQRIQSFSPEDWAAGIAEIVDRLQKQA